MVDNREGYKRQSSAVSCAEFSEFAKAWCFNHCISSPYYSQSNEKVESAVKILKGEVRCQQTKTYMKGLFTLNSFVNIAELKKVLLKAY